MYDEHVGKILHQNIIMDNILTNINEKTIFIIKGEKGQGKTFLLREIINKINNNDMTYEYLYLDNDKNLNINTYEPFFRIIKDNSTVRENLKNTILEYSQQNKLTKLVTDILKIFSLKKENTKFSNFNSDEMKLLLLFNNEIKNKKMILFCDNVDKWSIDSKKLLLAMIRYKNEFKGLKNLKFVITVETECDYFDNDCDLNFRLQTFNQNEFKKIMTYIYPDVIDFHNKSNSIYNIANQNLKIAKELYELVQDNQNIHSNNLRELVSNHFKYNIEDGVNILSFLDKVALLGMSSIRKLLEIFLDVDKNKQYSGYLAKTIAMKILNDKEGTIEFINTLIYDSIINSPNKRDKTEDYKRLSECITLIFPSNYIKKAEYLLYANENKNAQTYYLLYSLQYFRQKKEEESLYIQIYKLEGNLRIFYKEIINLYKLYYNNSLKKDFLEEKVIFIKPLVFTERVLEFEIDYIRALYYINYSYSKKDFHIAKEILSTWVTSNDFKKSNCEMWSRAAFLLMDLYYELDIEESKCKEIREEIDKIAKEHPLDSYMKDICYILYLKSNIYYEIAPAFHSTGVALNYFSQNINIYNNQQYLISVINHSANCIVLGKYEEADRIIHNLILNNNLILDKLYPEAITNNLIVTRYLNNKCSSKEAIKNMERISKYNSADKILILNNLITLYAEDGDFKKALNISEKLYNQIHTEHDVDDYYKYYIINNYSILKFLTGKIENAVDVFCEIQDLVPLSNNKEYFLKRNKYIKEIFNKIDRNTLLSDNSWNAYLIKKYPNTLGDAWNFWGKLLLLSDLQIWSDC